MLSRKRLKYLACAMLWRTTGYGSSGAGGSTCIPPPRFLSGPTGPCFGRLIRESLLTGGVPNGADYKGINAQSHEHSVQDQQPQKVREDIGGLMHQQDGADQQPREEQ